MSSTVAKFACFTCNAKFTTRRSLNRHTQSLHGSEEVKNHRCEECAAAFGRLDNLKRHMKTHEKDVLPPSKVFVCDERGKRFTLKRNMSRHQELEHGDKSSSFTCNECNLSFLRKDNLVRHMKIHLKPLKRKATTSQNHETPPVKKPASSISHERVQPVQKALRGNVMVYELPATSQDDFKDYLPQLTPIMQTILQNELKEKGAIKWYICVKVRFVKYKVEEEIETQAYFRSKMITTLESSNMQDQMENALSQVLKHCVEFQREGSNWTFLRFERAELRVSIFKPLYGSSYIPTPVKLQGKQALVNVKSYDQKCFVWSVLAALHPGAVNPNRVANYMEYEDELNLSGLSFPLPITQVEKFEKQNNISVNVFSYENDVFPLRISKVNKDVHVNLLLLRDGEKQHYVLVKNFSRLMSHLTKHCRQAYYCYYCLHRFSRQNLLDEHVGYCGAHTPQKTKLPTEQNKYLSFDNYEMQLKVPYIIYCDFEAFVKPISMTEPCAETSFTKKIASHELCGFCFVTVGIDGKMLDRPTLYRGDNVIETFINKLLEENKNIMQLKKTIMPMNLSMEEEVVFQQATTCHICRKPLDDSPVRDHCHITGRYRGPSHRSCNLNFKFGSFIPIVFHNLRSYDAHFIINEIGKLKDKKISCIPQNFEKYISFSIDNLRFIDSYQFLSASLENLVNNLSKEGSDKFLNLQEMFQGEKLKLLLRKGIYPYEYMTNADKFNEAKLPNQQHFFNSLADEACSNDNYQHAVTVWNTFEMKTMGDYHDLYLLSDTLQLADVFENFRSMCLKTYELDPAHMYTAAGFTFKACLKMSGVKLELLTDPNMYLFFESGIRGGIAMICNRYSKSNCPNNNDYDPFMPNKYISYFDANNLYGWSMSQALPSGNFSWMSKEELECFDVMTVSDNNVEGYVLEVDLIYPEALHDLHSDFPLAAERLTINQDMLSPHSKSVMKKLEVTSLSKCVKLIPNLNDKHHYIIHYRSLKQCLALGLQLGNIHKGIKFQQSAWLQSYIDFNTERRKQATSPFERDLYKLFNNAIYGKTLESVRNRISIELVNEEKRFVKLSASPRYEGFKIFSNDLVGVQMKLKCLHLNKPVFVGFSVLELSKTLIYKFHYEHIKKMYGKKARLLFTDTDSLCYEITTADIYQDMQQNKHLFDFSDYPPEHFLHSLENKKKLGVMKDEMSGKTILEFVGLRPKLYSLLTENDEKKRAKGVTKCVVRKHLRHQHYKKCLLEKVKVLKKMKSIQSDHHKVHTVQLNKVALDPLDDKRFILEDGISTLAHGHYLTKK